MNNDKTEGLKPSECFARLAKTVFSVTSAQLAEQEARSKADHPKGKPGPPKGTPNWRTKQKPANQQPTA